MIPLMSQTTRSENDPVADSVSVSEAVTRVWLAAVCSADAVPDPLAYRRAVVGGRQVWDDEFVYRVFENVVRWGEIRLVGMAVRKALGLPIVAVIG
jgi:hypothetical protein